MLESDADFPGTKRFTTKESGLTGIGQFRPNTRKRMGNAPPQDGGTMGLRGVCQALMLQESGSIITRLGVKLRASDFSIGALPNELCRHL